MIVKINVFGRDQHRAGHSEKPAALQSGVAGKVGQLSVDDVVFSEFSLISCDVTDVYSLPHRFGH